VRLLGLAPKAVFSGFESSFFDAVAAQGAAVRRIEIEVPLFKLLCTLASFHPNRKRWGTRRDRHYHTTITAFRRKSAFAHRRVLEGQDQADAVYQIGGLWNPTGPGVNIPFFLHVDYTSLLSKKRGSEWRRKPGKQEEFWVRQEKRLYERARLVLTTTENARQSILEDYGIPADKVVTVGAGVSAPFHKLQPERTPAHDARKVLFVGRGFRGKGLDTLLAAFERVRKRLPDVQLTIVGPTGENIVGEGVHYLGRIANRERVRELYYEHSLFVMPSRFEPLGQVFLEAMSCRLPCIGTTVDAMPEIIDHEKTGYTIDPGDAAKLAEYMYMILSDSRLAAQMGAAGLKRLQENYTWDVVGRKIHEQLKVRL
jgi:glycosyltransferase involved in cell wall biosynthesis